MLLDALSSVKCRTVGKARSKQAIKVATGADYESEDDMPEKKSIKRRRNKELDEFGDDYGSE